MIHRPRTLRLSLLLISLAACAPLTAEPEPTPAKKPLEQDGDPAVPSSKRAAFEKLMYERGSEADFNKAALDASKQGVSDQAILEARFLFLVDRHNDDKLIELLPKFEERKDKFDLSQSEIFAVKEDWLAVIEYLQSLAALKKGDKDGFKKHITEAFWLSPRQGSAFAPHIDRLRMDEAMKDLKIPLTTEFEDFKDSKITLASLAKDRKALLLHFWSPWSEEGEKSLPDFKAAATELEKNGIAVVTLLQPSADALDEAKGMLASAFDGHAPGVWVKGNSASALARTLRVQSVPVMVLLSTEGAVLYNGDPSDDGLWKALKKVAPSVKRPSMPSK